MKECIFMALLGLNLSVPKAHAQWVVTDPGNFTGNIISSVKEVVTAFKTVKNTLSGFREVGKLYNNTEKYHDALKKVNNLIGDAYRVKEYILMVGGISKTYVTLYKKMPSDKNFCPSEPAAMVSDYAKLLEQSGESLKKLKFIAKNNILSMNGHEQMQQMDRIYTTLREYRSLVSYYTRKNISVSCVHAREESDLVSVEALYGNMTSRY